MCRINVKYSVFLRRNCLVGGLCYEILELLELWFPIDGNYVINCFIWARGYSFFKRGSAEFSANFFFMYRLSLELIIKLNMKSLSFALRALEWSSRNWVSLKGTRRLPRVGPFRVGA